MARNIAIMDSVYEELAKRKRPDESFSAEIRRLIGTKKNILEFAGVCKMTAEESREMHALVKKLRADSDKRIVERIRSRS
ncbi:antitoxin VapB family protein [Candidatus Woesearchaeota archaeon]|nr:antitoxin VapB family protein [Candidatus Woesearchaeota archaeon]